MIGELQEEQIQEYVASGAWRGKSGGYNLADRIEAGWPIECEGDPATVMGLPMVKLVPQLNDLLSEAGQ
jgi:predicted house-cleaning NTP pyrophosphatase (Maf/HAM1 superfamily)